jgi:hypothetical protein
MSSSSPSPSPYHHLAVNKKDKHFSDPPLDGGGGGGGGDNTPSD